MALSKKEFFLLIGIVVLFFAVRIPGLGIPYHQDEYKWPLYAEEKVFAPGTIPHPPLTEFIYRVVGKHIGLDNFRFVPLLFSTLNLFLLFYLVKTIFDPFDRLRASRTALWAVLLFALSYYSVLASLMVDVDGAVMPTFFLLMSIGYYRARKTNFQFSISNSQSIFNLAIFLIGAVGCFLVKVSGLLPLVAFAIDFSVIKGFFADRKRFLKFVGLGAALALGAVAVLLVAKLIFPFFPIEKSLQYWRHFAVFADRGWLQTLIQFAKAVMYLSPLLVLPALLIDREIWGRARPFFYFIFLGLFFYLLAFDFSLGALDRYLQFLVLPLSIISAAVLAKYMRRDVEGVDNICKPDVAAVSVVSIGIFALQFFEQAVPPLYPKTEWLSRLVSFKWNFLFPFTGGSGPIPFYVSFQFIALLWIVSIVFVALALWNRGVAKRSLFALLVLGLVYNLVFTEEYLFGKINGNSTKLVDRGVEYIKSKDYIQSVAVYNDNGGYDVRQLGIYERRIYAAPQFEETYKEFFSKFKGHILYVDAPRVQLGSFYDKYFRSCKVEYGEKDKYTILRVLDCRKR